MLLPRLAGQAVSVWSDTFLRPLLSTGGNSAGTNATSARIGATSDHTNGKGAAANGAATNGTVARAAKPGVPLAGGGALPGIGFGAQLIDYWFDRAQRSLLLLDVLRERGNNSLDHSRDGMPPVLTFDSELILDGRTLDRPANYALLEVKPRDHQRIDPQKRPYIIVDPRAGHGPGVGGFKEDSQIGMAMRAGHACYLVSFFRDPVPGQTIADVHHVQTMFVRAVRERHPDADKPAVLGNCQGGWGVAIVAAEAPDDFGPLMLTGAPLSYWAGAKGDSPLRFAGGLLGGAWVLSFQGDVGNGRFDGANAVANFELMNPANSMWGKTYSLFRNIDGEAQRFLDFERWWGAFFLTNTEEIRFIGSELFISNKLAQGRLVQDEGRDPVDLRNIRSPIIVFCSWGDTITPPHQALHWILDTYPTDEDLLANEQTIIYMLHDTVGHLGIFVSGDVARKEHAEVIRTLEMVDMLPPGLYEMKIRDREPGHAADEPIPHRYLVNFEERTLADIRNMGGSVPDERPFEAAARLSEINERLYRRYVSPWVRLLANEPAAVLQRTLHPGRLRQYAFSDRVNPAMRIVKAAAARVRKNRRPVAGDNVFVELEQAFSDRVIKTLDGVRDVRDGSQERLFRIVYENATVQAILGARTHRSIERGDEAARRAQLTARLEAITARDTRGGTLEAFVRIYAYIHGGQSAAEERGFLSLRQIYREAHENTQTTLIEFKAAVREQTFLVRLDEERALATLPGLLPDSEHRIATMHAVRELERTLGPVDEAREARIRRVEEILDVDEKPLVNIS